jgi:uncharacterized radical SAM superfamily Fe-S cluster-containing enzyme
MKTLTISQPELLKKTLSRCPQCLAECPAEVWKIGDAPAKVYLKKACAEHGKSMVCISSDARFYWMSQGDPSNAGGCCAKSAEGDGQGYLGKNALSPNRVESLSTCLALIEIVDSCNLACPTCFADSPTGVGAKVKAVPLYQIKNRVQGVIDRKGGIEILQLSGGEPTLHPQFFELLDWCQSHEKIDYVLVNTNGVRLARDEAFSAEFGRCFDYGKLQLYLQFDGVELAGQEELRGGDLREMKKRAIERAGELGIPLTFAMTVIPENLKQVWRVVDFGLRYEHVRGVSFQPMFFSGRSHSVEDDVKRLNTADILLNLVGRSGGKLKFDDFTPLPCGDPNCATIGYLLKVEGEVRSISDFVDFDKLQGFLGDRVRYRPEDLAKCGCESEPLGGLLHQLEMDERHTFRLFIKPFMDAHSWDQDRIDRCCTHVIRPDGELDSFCRYYLTGV